MPQGHFDPASQVTKAPSKLGSILSQGLGMLGPIGTGIDLVGQIAGMFKPNQANLTATAQQKALETAAMQIQDYVNKGLMDPDAAMSALMALAKQAGGMGGGGEGGQELANGGNISGINIQNILANMRSRKTAAAQQPLSAGLSGTAGQQRAQIGNALRRQVTGVGDPLTWLKGSPIDQAITPRDTTASFNQSAQTAMNTSPIDLPSVKKRPLMGLY